MNIIEKLEYLTNNYDSDTAKDINILDIKLTDLNYFMEKAYLKQVTIFFILKLKFVYYSNNNFDELAYCSYLISYYVLICLTPFGNDEIAFYYANKSIEFSNDLLYKKWIIENFTMYPSNYLSGGCAKKLASDILQIDKNHEKSIEILSRS